MFCGMLEHDTSWWHMARNGLALALSIIVVAVIVLVWLAVVLAATKWFGLTTFSGWLSFLAVVFGLTSVWQWYLATETTKSDALSRSATLFASLGVIATASAQICSGQGW